ncbi:phage tail protein I [Desulfosporosinus fructosivorans]|uniref:Phage tail protein I n=1 Tax=Desulfosporosinus fructosivorans TaxID=2018669 RepID=A0A4Z0R3W7_9FIRM|nr:phage tail protein I [Desulfosporosinus fructosivorans]TGE37085.1 phage tail protein I [Desulfosporosinus fructosivorans]
MDLSDVDLLSLQSSYMKNDPTTIAFCRALSPQFQQLSGEAKKCSILARLNQIKWATISPGLVVKVFAPEITNEQVLDELAWQLNIKWYDPSVDIATKQQIVRSAIIVHMYKGTPYAVEQIIQTYFGDGEVQEWFDYGGEPGMFKVLTTNPSVTADLANQFTTVLNSVKNMRSHLEVILISLSGQLDIYFGGAVHTGDFIETRQVG